MTNEIVKQGFADAEKELQNEKVSEVKKIVKKTLEKIRDLDKSIDELQEKRKILKLDIEDLKDGKLDRIVERQEKDEKAKQVSVVVIIKEKEVIREVSPWYWPYRIIWNQPTYVPAYPFIQPAVTWCTTAIDNSCTIASNTYTNVDTDLGRSYINCSIAKDSTPGAYDVEGKVVNLR